jgi:hypothetical protein
MKNKIQTFTTTIQEDQEGAFVILPQEMLETLDWDLDTQLRWTINTNSILLTKINSQQKEVL